LTENLCGVGNSVKRRACTYAQVKQCDK